MTAKRWYDIERQLIRGTRLHNTPLARCTNMERVLQCIYLKRLVVQQSGRRRVLENKVENRQGYRIRSSTPHTSLFDSLWQRHHPLSLTLSHPSLPPSPGLC